MDEGDMAEATEELHRQMALKSRKPAGPVACGACYYCSSPVAAGARWCDSACSADWESLNKLRVINGDAR